MDRARTKNDSRVAKLREVLQADSTLHDVLLQSYPGIIENDLTNCRVHFNDAAGADFDKESEVISDSRFNQIEAELVVK
jgi:hypothetical protein